MFALDLSLHIPGAPVVCREPAAGTLSNLLEESLPAKASCEPHPNDPLRLRTVLAHVLANMNPSQMPVVPAGAVVEGELVCQSIRIQGEHSGSISASGLVHIEANAILRGVVKCAENLILSGTVMAPPDGYAIRCNGLVVLAQTARVIGHIQCHSIAIYQGACLAGTVQAFQNEM